MGKYYSAYLHAFTIPLPNVGKLRFLFKDNFLNHYLCPAEKAVDCEDFANILKF